MKIEEIIRIYMELDSKILSNNVILLKVQKKIENLARIYVHQYNNKFIAYFRNELPIKVKRTLFHLSSDSLWYDENLVISILNTHRPCMKIGIDKNYYFTHLTKEEDFPDVTRENNQFVIKKNTIIVSQAFTVSENEYVADMAVETAEPYRKQGFGYQVASAWGNAIIHSNRIGLYIHDSNNRASERLAEKLRVRLFSTCKEYY